jgi:hypothetical protein
MLIAPPDNVDELPALNRISPPKPLLEPTDT